uniref:ARAD1B03542p n=1 Tax=Blastobotrys adeninivorans TaxID=409370 RepID=A0A060T4Y1_BLAAD
MDQSSLPSVGDVKSRWEQLANGDDNMPSPRPVRPINIKEDSGDAVPQIPWDTKPVPGGPAVQEKKPKPPVAPKPARLSADARKMSAGTPKGNPVGPVGTPGAATGTPSTPGIVVESPAEHQADTNEATAKVPPPVPPHRSTTPAGRTGSPPAAMTPTTSSPMLSPNSIDATLKSTAKMAPPPPPSRARSPVRGAGVGTSSEKQGPPPPPPRGSRSATPTTPGDRPSDDYFSRSHTSPRHNTDGTSGPSTNGNGLNGHFDGMRSPTDLAQVRPQSPSRIESPPPLPPRRTDTSASSSTPNLLAAPELPPRPSRSLSPALRTPMLSPAVESVSSQNFTPPAPAPASASTVSSAPSVPVAPAVPPAPSSSTGSLLASPMPESMSTPPLTTDDFDASAPVSRKNSADETCGDGYPDSSQANRRAPIFEGVLHEITTKAEVKAVANYGNLLCVSASATQVHDVYTGQVVWSLSHPDTKVTAIAFKPLQTKDPENHGRVLWLGTKDGQIWEVSIDSPGVLAKRANAHLTPIVLIQGQADQIWTVSEDGKVCVWPNDLTAIPKSYRATPNFKAVTGAGSQLWIGRNKQTNIYQPSMDPQSQFILTPRPIPAVPNLSGRQIGEFSCAGRLPSCPDLVFFGHEDGAITTYSQSKMATVESINVSLYKICAIRGIGRYLWIGLKNGHILVCDVQQRPWRVMKEWKAHDGPVLEIHGFDASLWQSNNGMLPVVSFSTGNTVCIWDGLLKHDWIERDMQVHDEEYCTFNDISVRLLTWNAGAAKPQDLERNEVDNSFLRDLVTCHGEDLPDVFVFGFQELVELDNKSVTAKTMLSKRKKENKEVSTSSHISGQYKAWQDRLFFTLANFLAEPYKLVHSNNMVGLFTCVFVKNSLVPRIRGVQSSAVKTGLGGLHGNKGGLAVRLIVDDSSLCFVNCHLAAGQSSAPQRNKDIETILETQFLQSDVNSQFTGKGIFVNGGDGTMILDHEICFFSGDMNYRINMQRLQAMKAIQSNDFEKLLENDQLHVQLKRNPGMRLRKFQEAPIRFAPTYKFDVGTDDYDTSEKKRVPAWCDRIFYRGGSRVAQLDYRSHTVRVSDHRPVSGLFTVQVKTIDGKKRNEAYKGCLERWRQNLDHAVQNSRWDASY